MRVLVTGGTGFAGRWIVRGLQERGAKVIACSRNPSPTDGIETIAADLLDPGTAYKLVTQVAPDIILHAAWCVDHGKFWNAPANLDWAAASLRLARAAAEHGVGRFVGVGTCFEYAWPATSNCNEAITPVEPTTLYAIAKDATRRIIETYAIGAGMAFAWGRLFYLFGPHEHPDRLASSVAIKLARNMQAPLSSGLVVRDFMDIRDAGNALAALALSPVTGAVNIGSGEGMRIADLAKQLQQAAGGSGQLQIGALPDRPGEPPRIVADVERLRQEVGFQPDASIEDRLAQTYQWWQQHLPG
jgi:nucleoside-diphosphate-sugar epimerase